MAHRRSGKTVASIFDLVRGALSASNYPRPRYSYIAPFLSQAKSVAWDYLRSASAPHLELGAKINETELRVDYPDGGRVRLFGADNADALRGTYNDGVVLDEFAQFDPRVWPEIIRPTLSDRKGWAVFIGTVRGHNAFYKLYNEALDDPANWFTLMLKASQTGILSAEELEDARKTSFSEEAYNQEYECDWEAALIGAFYAKAMNQLDAAGQITGVPYDPSAQVYTAWDLGIRDAMSIWFAQRVGREIHLIDYYESSGAGLDHYARVLGEKPYAYAGHILPHDIQVAELGTGKSRLETLSSLGIRKTEICKNVPLEDGINAVRMLLPRCYFDRQKCARGIEALRIYRQEFDKRLMNFRAAPVHDWASHPADAFRYLALTIDNVGRGEFYRPINYPKRGVA